jgi:hypothetical protein
MRRIRFSAVAVAALALGGCAIVPPTGPEVVAMPGKDKSFAAFQADDAACRQYASAQIGNTAPGDAASQSAIGSTVVGTIAGAAIGTVIGAATGNPATGAAVGAGGGLLVGGAGGAGAAQASDAALQRRYDIGYAQCMSAKGESVQVPTVAYQAYPAYAYGPYDPYYYPPYYGGVRLGIGFGFHHHHFHHFHH